MTWYGKKSNNSWEFMRKHDNNTFIMNKIGLELCCVNISERKLKRYVCDVI
jgi:hypothetical protein